MGLPRKLLNHALHGVLTHDLFHQSDMMDVVLGYLDMKAIRPIKHVRRSARLKRTKTWSEAVDTHASDDSWSSADSNSSSDTESYGSIGESSCESDGILVKKRTTRKT